MTRFGSIVCIAAALLAGTPAFAQNFDLSWHTIDGGGGASRGGDFTLSGTIGQSDAGSVMSGGEFELFGGFWSGASPCGCVGDLDRDCAVGLQDLAILLAHFATPDASPDQGDIDHDGAVTLQDLAFLLGNFGSACR
jgi:hypothetical protein